MDGMSIEFQDTFNVDVITGRWLKGRKKAMKKIGLLIQGAAMLLCPVDTGRLRGSLTHATDDFQSATRGAARGTDQPVSRPMDEGTVHIGTNVEYAPWVEYGTSSGWKGGYYKLGRKAQSYLRRAMDENRENVVKLYQETMHGELG